MKKFEVWKRKIVKQERKKIQVEEASRKIGQIYNALQHDLVKVGFYS